MTHDEELGQNQPELKQMWELADEDSESFGLRMFRKFWETWKIQRRHSVLDMNTGVFGMTFTPGDINGRLDIQNNMQKKRSVNAKT